MRMINVLMSDSVDYMKYGVYFNNPCLLYARSLFALTRDLQWADLAIRHLKQ